MDLTIRLVEHVRKIHHPLVVIFIRWFGIFLDNEGARGRDCLEVDVGVIEIGSSLALCESKLVVEVVLRGYGPLRGLWCSV